jgi:hypothetical protein
MVLNHFGKGRIISQLGTECLKVNKLWAPLSVITVRKAFSDAMAGAVTFMRIENDYPIIYTLDDWMKIEAEEGEDHLILGIKNHEQRRIRVPRIVICTRYDQLIAKEQPCNTDNLHRRYKGTDPTTGKPLPRERTSREHVRPRSKGGKSGWDNEVPMDRDLNSRRGNKSYRKVGLRKPVILGAPPKVLPIHTIVNKKGYPEWDYFHIRRS